MVFNIFMAVFACAMIIILLIIIKSRHILTLIIGGSVNSRFKSDAHM